MRVKEGDVLVCECEDCETEIKVTKSCSQGTCHTEGNIEVTCCGKPMKRKEG